MSFFSKPRTIFTLALFTCAALAFKPIKAYVKKHNRPDLTVIGYADMTDGIGRQAVELIQALHKDFSVRMRFTRPINLNEVPLSIQKIMKKDAKTLGKVVIYEDIFFKDTSRKFFEKRFKKWDPSQIKIAYSMLESTRIPDEWVDNINTFFDAVVVPDPFLVDVYKGSGVKVPVFILPIGLDLQPFLERPIKTKRQNPMVFANFGTCTLRKNHVDLIKAFHGAFGNRDDVKLLINCKLISRNETYEELIKEIAKLNTTNITLTTNCYSKKDYLKLFEGVDCYASLSKSEGFSIQPREAMALGIPSIVSDNTAQSTICQTGLVSAVPCPFREPAYYEHWNETWGERFNIDIDQATQAFIDMYDNYDNYLAKSEKARAWVSQYDYSKIGTYYKTLVKPQKIIFCKDNKIEQNVLFTSSKELILRYVNIYPDIVVEERYEDSSSV